MDYKDPGSATVVHRVIAGLHPGAVVSLHFGHPGTIEALPAILDGIASVAAASIPGRRVGHRSSLRSRVVLGRRCQHRRANTNQAGEVEHDHCCPATTATSTDPANIYAGTNSERVSPALSGDLTRVSVPDGLSGCSTTREATSSRSTTARLIPERG
jgi:hypothetical protein